MSRIIEFMGVPGAGKTTLARELMRLLRKQKNHDGLWYTNEKAVARALRLKNQGILCRLLRCLPYSLWHPVAGNQHLMFEMQGFAAAYPHLMKLAFEIIAEARPLWRACILSALFKRASERFLLDTSLPPSDGALIEEGFSLGALTLFDCLPVDFCCDHMVEDYVHCIPLPDAVIWIDVDPGACIERLQQRAAVPLLWQGTTNAEFRSKVEWSCALLHQVAICLRNRGVPVHMVSSEAGNLNASIKQLSDLTTAEPCFRKNPV